MKRFLLVSQVFPPDPAAVGQHLGDVASELERRGHQVTVLTADRGFDDTSQRYPKLEQRGGLTIHRLPASSFGKGGLLPRIAGGASLLAQALVRLALAQQFDHALLTTSPPFAGALGLALKRLRGVPFTYWLMDINPDQLVNSGKIAPDAAAVRAFDALNRQILREAATLIALDLPMAERFVRKLRPHWTPNKIASDGLNEREPGCARVVIIPPWSPERFEAPLPHRDNPFRQQHWANDECLVMYSGNHSLVHPLDTLLEAARGLPADSRLRLAFIGGGKGKEYLEARLRAAPLPTVTCLPYQERTLLQQSLNAADVHVVSVGNATVGVVHPSKIYGAMALGRLILVLGPRDCPAAQLVRERGLGWQVEHGDVAGMKRVLGELEMCWKGRMAPFSEADFAVRATGMGERDQSLGRVVELLLAST